MKQSCECFVFFYEIASQRKQGSAELLWRSESPKLLRGTKKSLKWMNQKVVEMIDRIKTFSPCAKMCLLWNWNFMKPSNISHVCCNFSKDVNLTCKSTYQSPWQQIFACRYSMCGRGNSPMSRWMVQWILTWHTIPLRYYLSKTYLCCKLIWNKNLIVCPKYIYPSALTILFSSISTIFWFCHHFCFVQVRSQTSFFGFSFKFFYWAL